MPNYASYAGILDGLTIPPLFLLLGGVVLGFFLARKFPNVLPAMFKPASTEADLAALVEAAVKKALDDKK